MVWHDAIGDLQDALTAQFGGDDLFDYAPAGGGAPTTGIRGIFRDAAELVETAAGDADLISVQPRLDVRLADLPGGLEPGVRDGSTFTRQRTGRVYEVAVIEPDGEGMLSLQLYDLTPL